MNLSMIMVFLLSRQLQQMIPMFLAMFLLVHIQILLLMLLNLKPKKPRTEAEDELLFLSYMEQADEGYVLTVDIELNSQREKERFIQQPTLMLVQKLREL